MSKKLTDARPAFIIWGLFAAFFFFAFFYAAFNNHFSVDHNALVPGNSNYPESYTVYPSPALVFSATWSFARVLGLLIFLGLGVYLFFCVGDYLGQFATEKVNLITFIGLLLSLILFFASHSNKVAGNNKVTIKPERYENIQHNNDSLKNLFDTKKFY